MRKILFMSAFLMTMIASAYAQEEFYLYIGDGTSSENAWAIDDIGRVNFSADDESYVILAADGVATLFSSTMTTDARWTFSNIAPDVTATEEIEFDNQEVIALSRASEDVELIFANSFDGEFRVVLYDISGRICFNELCTLSDRSLILPTEQLPRGVYQVYINMDNKNLTTRFIR